MVFDLIPLLQDQDMSYQSPGAEVEPQTATDLEVCMMIF